MGSADNLASPKAKVCTACAREYGAEDVVCSEDGAELIAKDGAELIAQDGESIIGTLLDDRFRILGELGQGGMGVVYKAEHEAIKRMVAVKMLQWSMDDERYTQERFRHEAQALAALDSTNIVSARDFGFSAAGQPFLVMDLVQGRTLEESIKETGGLPAAKAVETFLQICDALAHAHSKGIIHRDLKPGNIVLVPGEDGREIVKVVDFGLAKLSPALQQAQMKLTRTGAMLGSPLYMSPEQWTGQEPDARSDIYSFGCVMYEAMCGRVPLEGEQLVAIMLESASFDPAPFHDVKPDLEISEQLEKLIFKALERDKQMRQQSASELRRELERTPEFQAVDPAKIQAQKIKNYQDRKRRRVLISAGSAAAALIVAVGSFAWYGSTPSGKINIAKLDVSVQEMFAGKGNPRLIEPLTKLGEIAFNLKNYGEAADAYARVVKLGEASEKKSTKLADAYFRLSECYAHQEGRMQEASQCLKTALNMYLQVGEEFFSKNDYRNAIDVYKQVVRKMQVIGGSNNQPLLMPLRRLGDIELRAWQATHDPSFVRDAEEHFKQALSIMDDKYNPDVLEMSEDLADLGSVFEIEGKYADAATAYKKAYQIRKAKLGVGNAKTALTADFMTELASNANKHGRPADAEAIYKEALVEEEETRGKSSLEVGRLLFNLSYAQRGVRKVAEAEASARRAAQILAERKGQEDAEVGAAILAQSDCVMYLAKQESGAQARARYEEAARLLPKAMAIFRKGGPALTKLLTTAMQSYATALRNLNQPEQADKVEAEIKAICGT